MKIPKQYQHFQKPTIIAITDNQKAKLLLANNDQIEELEIIETEEEAISDTQAMSGGQPHLESMPEQKEHDQHMIKDHLYPALNKNLLKRLENKEFEELIIFVPEQNKGFLEDALHSYLTERLQIIPVNVMKESLEQIIKRIQNK